MKFRRLLLIFLLLFPPTIAAQEVRILGGALKEGGLDAGTYAWQLEYKEALTERFGYSFTHLNEGHLPQNHRDGHAVQLWVGKELLGRRLSMAAAAGPYFSYNTALNEGKGRQLNEHELGALLGLTATWYSNGRWLYELRTNYVAMVTGIDTFAVLFGIGYQLTPPPSPGPAPKPPPQSRKTTENEWTVFIGETNIHNGQTDNDTSRHSLAAGLEYRRGLWKHIDWSATFLYEGKNGLSDRTGIMTQLWGVRSFMDEVLTLGAGVGPYLAVDRLRNPEQGKSNDLRPYAAISMTGSYRVDPSWAARLHWHRIISDNHRDSDVWTVGASYLF